MTTLFPLLNVRTGTYGMPLPRTRGPHSVWRVPRRFGSKIRNRVRCVKDAIFSRQAYRKGCTPRTASLPGKEAAFSIWGEAGQKTRPPVTATLPPGPHVRNVDGLESPVPMAKSIYPYSERRASAVSEKDNNTREDAVVRGEHQHFWEMTGIILVLWGKI